jgi:hypothetical protein
VCRFLLQWQSHFALPLTSMKFLTQQRNRPGLSTAPANFIGSTPLQLMHWGWKKLYGQNLQSYRR